MIARLSFILLAFAGPVAADTYYACEMVTICAESGACEDANLLIEISGDGGELLTASAIWPVVANQESDAGWTKVAVHEGDSLVLSVAGDQARAAVLGVTPLYAAHYTGSCREMS